MNSSLIKIVTVASVLTLLGAGCSSQPQADAAQAPLPMGTGSSTSGTHRGGFGMQNIPAGMKPFFGKVGSMSGSMVTLSGRNSTTTVNFISATQFKGGAQAEVKTGVMIVGYGAPNSDGSIDAQNVQINPTMPAGGARGANRGGSGGYRAGGTSSSHSGTGQGDAQY